ncbi:MAG: hypothetical protein C5B45_03720 [Chlamydiae bacterium]|nr:MAG: hypothetical protein C5B45_03720 [Chlamydiota bacterium]
MINNLNISNLQVFNKEGASLPCSSDLQEAMQIGIAKKVGKLLNAEGFLALIPNFDPTKDTKLRIHLTKEGITIQLLERAVEDAKAAPSYTKKDPELSEEIKTRKEKIITKVDSLFKEPPSFSSSPELKSDKIHPLFIPSQPSKDEQSPFTIGFDATVSNPQIQQLHAKIEALQDQLNKKTPHSEELQVIKEQLQLLTELIHNSKQENITYPQTEQYVLINKLVDNQRDICRALLVLLSRNLNQTSNTTPLTPSPTQTDIENANNLTSTSHEKDSQSLIQKEQEIITLQAQLSNLQQEKDSLVLEQQNLTEQLAQTQTAQTNLSTNYAANVEQLEHSNASLQTQISTKDKQIITLEQQIRDSHNAHQELKEQLSKSQQEIATLKQKSKELPNLQAQLSNLQQEKDSLVLEQQNLAKQLAQANQNQIKSSTTFEDEVKRLKKLTEDLQMQLSAKDEQINNSTAQSYKETSQLLAQKEQEMAVLKKQLEELSQLPSQLSNLQEEKIALGLEQQNLIKQLEILQSDKAGLQLQQATLTSCFTELIQTREVLETANTTLQNDLPSKDKEIITLKQQIQSLPTNDTQRLQSQIELLQSEKNHLVEFYEKERNEVNNKITGLQSQLTLKKESLIELQSQVKTLIQPEELKKLQMQIFQLESDKASLNSKLSTLEYALSNLEKTLSNYEIVDENAQKSIESALKAMESIKQESHASSYEHLSTLLSIESMGKEDLKEVIASLTQQLDDTSIHTSHEYKRLQSDLQAKENLVQNLEEESTLYKQLLSKAEEKNLQELASRFEDQRKEMEILTTVNEALNERLHEKVESEKGLKDQLLQANKILGKEKQHIKKVEQEFEEEFKNITKQLVLEKKTRLEQEKIYDTLIQNLEQEKAKAAEKRTEIMKLLIQDLEKKQSGSCMILLEFLINYTKSGSISKEDRKDILDILAPAFEHTPEFIRFSSSSSKDSNSSVESESSDEYEDDFL